MAIVHFQQRDNGFLIKGHEALVLAEHAARDGRTEEAERLVEIAYRLFDAQAMQVCIDHYVTRLGKPG